MPNFIKHTKSKFILLTGIIALSSFSILKFAWDKNQVLMGLLIDGLGQMHYNPVKIDDTFSEKVFTLYLKQLDVYKRFLIQSDVDQLAKFRRDIDNEVNEGRFDLYKTSIEIISKRNKQAETWYKEFLSKPFDFNVDEEYETDSKKSKYANTEAELKNEWHKLVKYQVLQRIDEALARQEKAKEKNDTTFKIKSYDSLEVDARRKTLKYDNDWFKLLNKITNKERFGIYLNTIANIYDPHTQYFAPKDKKKFDQGMSGQFEGIGARLAKNADGALEISEIIVGSPSFKQGELKAKDQIIKVAQGVGEPVDITVMETDDAIDLIKGKKGTEVRLTVKKPDGSQKIIAIIRDIIEMDDVYAKAVILNNGNRKIGYIYLPEFYADFTRNGAHRCAVDMRKEIDSLKKEKIEGLIIDIRDNGGGSLQEVVEMAGLFINKGPVVQVKAKNNLINVMEDHNPDIVWDGPLSIMVNHNSASASEILAAAIQDYKRGVIVGSPTFGKGTVQSFLDLDQYLLPQFDTIKPIGQVKITMQKFYRINGGATQLKGVIPDVVLTDPYALIDNYGEKDMDFPMEWDEIAKANYAPYTYINYDKIKKSSEERTKKSTSFKLMETEAKEYKDKRDDTKYNLKFEKYRAELKLWRDQNKKYEDLRKMISGFSAELLAKDKRRLSNDSTKLGRENRWAKNIAKDFYIYETSNIVGDLK